MGQMKFGVCVSHRKIGQRNIKVNPRGKYNTLHDEIFFLFPHAKGEREIICLFAP